MKIRHIEISNFRGIKELKADFSSDFICLIGSGDSCKSTLLTAIEYALYPKWNLQVEDTDYYNVDTEKDIVIELTFTDWDEHRDIMKDFFSEDKFGQLKCGYSNKEVKSEPANENEIAVTINLTIDKNYEPKWYIRQGEEKKEIFYKDRCNVFSFGKIDSSLDNNFTFGKIRF